MSSRERMALFLYLLMRDKLATGEVQHLIRNSRESFEHNADLQYSSPELHALATRYADELLTP